MALTVKDYGARGDGMTDDTAAIQAAINSAADQGRMLFVPSGVYIISETLVIPRDVDRLTHFAIEGEFASSVYKARARGGAILKTTSAAVTVLRAEALGAPNDDSRFWTQHLELSNLYVVGPHEPSYGPASGVGVDLGWLQFGRFHNLHVQGFGTGLRIMDGSEFWLTGLTLVVGCYQGVHVKRSRAIQALETDPLPTDMQAWFENLVTLENWTNLTLENPRSVWVQKGENIMRLQHSDSPTLPEPPKRVKVVNCFTDTQIHFVDYLMENQSQEPSVQVDAKGLGVLSFDRCNFETAGVPTLVRCDGFFDLISIRGCSLARGVLNPGVKEPLVWLRAPGATGGADRNDQLRSMNLVIEGNTPAVADCWVRDETRGSGTVTFRDPLHDVVPSGFQQINPRPQMDEANDNRIQVVGGPYGFTVATPLAGKGRLYWVNVTPANGVVFTPPRPLTGVRILYLALIADVPDDMWVPAVTELNGLGADFFTHTTKLETYLVGSRTFTKYAITVTVAQPTGPINSIKIANFYGGSNLYGLEALNVYVNADHTGPISSNRRTRSSAPSAATDGVHARGDVVYNSAPTGGAYEGWICTVAGVPGTWKGFGLIAT